MLEILKQMKISITFLDIIKEVPTYAKFFKDMYYKPSILSS